MPPISKITKAMIINAGKEIVQSDGIDNLNVIKIASKLNCSTQPIMYHYKTVDELKNEIYTVVDEYHSKYIMNINCDKVNPILEIGLRYILFAAEEKNILNFFFSLTNFQI